MYAIIETGGKQHRVEQGGVLVAEKLPQAAEEKITFDRVLFYSNGTGGQVGKPYLKNVSVQGKILEHGKADKVVVFKYKRKVNYRRTKGHRQLFTKVLIEQIQAN